LCGGELDPKISDNRRITVSMRNAPPFTRHKAITAPNLFGGGAPGLDNRYVTSGASRSMSYEAWKDLEKRQAALEGRRPDLPPEDKNGIPLDIAHYADPDEVRAWAHEVIAREGSVEDRKRKLTELDARMGDDFKAAMESGDMNRLRNVVRSAYLELRDTDPVMQPSPVPTPGDFTNEFATPVDPTEIIALCEELGLWNALPEIVNGSQVESWRELDQLEFASGCNAIAFTPGECPEDQVHHTATETMTKRHIGVKKSLTESDIRHSAASIAAGVGVNALIGGFNDTGLPGDLDGPSLIRASISDVKEKEARLSTILTLNGWDDLLVNGDNAANPLEFDGIVNSITAANGARACPSWMSGTFSAANFDRFLAAGCGQAQAILGHPTALAELAVNYWGLGSQTAFFDDNANMSPGRHFTSSLITGIGPVSLIGDTRFPRVDNGDGTFRTILYPVVLTHNGEPLIYKATQIPLSYKDLTPGCSAIAFEVWAVTALVVKAMCAQALCELTFSGFVDDGCTYVHPCTPTSLP